MKELFSTYKLLITLGIFGLVLAVLWITVGSFETLLILIMAVIGVAIGFYLKQTRILGHYLRPQKEIPMNNDNRNNNSNKMNNQKPVLAHPDPTIPNQSSGMNDEKNKTTPVSAHPDPVAPDVRQDVREKKHDAEEHASHHPDSPGPKIPEQHNAIDPSKPLEEQKHPSDRVKAQERLNSEHSSGQEKFGSQHTNDRENHDSKQEDSMRGELNYEDKAVQKIIEIAVE